MRKTSILSIIVGCQFFAAQAMATDYRFHVSCQSSNSVVVWKTGDIDPGREYLRVVTGTKNPNCAVSDYNEKTDAGLPVETYSHEAGVIAGIPFVGWIICGVFGC